MKIKDKKGSENLMAGPLSRLEIPNTVHRNQAQIDDAFPDEQILALFQIKAFPWFVDIANYLVVGIDECETHIALSPFLHAKLRL